MSDELERMWKLPWSILLTRVGSSTKRRSESCAVAGFGTSGGDPSGPITRP